MYTHIYLYTDIKDISAHHLESCFLVFSLGAFLYDIHLLELTLGQVT